MYIHFPKRNKKMRKKINLWTKMKYNAGQNAQWHACMYSYTIFNHGYAFWTHADSFIDQVPFFRSFRSFDYYNTWYVPKSRYVICSISVWIYIQHNFGIFDIVHSSIYTRYTVDTVVCVWCMLIFLFIFPSIIILFRNCLTNVLTQKHQHKQ